MKKKFSLILLAVLLVLVMATCVACGDNDTPDTPAAPTGVTCKMDQLPSHKFLNRAQLSLSPQLKTPNMQP